MPISFVDAPWFDLNGRTHDPDIPRVNRHWYITDIDGQEVEIRSQADLDRVIAQMTQEQFEAWKTNYRFTPIMNNTKRPGYQGGINDRGSS